MIEAIKPFEVIVKIQARIIQAMHSLSAARWQSIRSFLLFISAVFFSLLTVGMQIHQYAITNEERFAYIEEGPQMLHHQTVLDGEQGSPWQYRVFSVYLTEGTIRLLDASNVPHHVLIGFVFWRVLQNIAIFLVAYLYYHRYLGLRRMVTYLGLMTLAWAMTHSGYGSDLSHNSYFDMLFYLLSSIAIFERKFVWIIPITVVAAFNRETSLFIPILAAAVLYFHYHVRIPNREYVYSAIAAVAFFLIFLGLRLHYGFRSTEDEFGIARFLQNLADLRGWLLLAATLGIIPIMAYANYTHWHPIVRIFLWTMVPAWFAIHFFSSIVAETRLFLVPLALVLIPGALLGLSEESSGTTALLQET